MNLVLHLKFEYYDQIKRGEKLEEYRLTEKWEKRIVGKNFDNVVLWRGYQSGVFMVLPWQGYTRKTITHPHFGNAPVEVFAISVAPNNACTGQLAGEGKADGESTPSANCQ